MNVKWDTDRIVGLSAMLVGLGSLFMVIYQTALIRDQQKASVLPYLMIAFNSSDAGSYIALRNVGLGPAKIEQIRIRYEGKSFDGDPYQYYAQLAGAKVPADRLYRDRVLPGMLIPAGTDLQMLGSSNSSIMYSELLRTFQFVAVQDPRPSEETTAAPANRAVLEIEYASVYGERWRVRSDRVIPESL
jgi:hypothetical protein